MPKTRTMPFYFNLPSGAGQVTIHLPQTATVADVEALARFIHTSEKSRLGGASDYPGRVRLVGDCEGR